jgi:modification methylase
LLYRVLLASTGHDDIILDPFAGTGTTAVVARRTGRHFIAIERHPAYVEAAWGRLRRARRGSDDGIAMTATKRDAPRIPFGTLVERGVVPPGTRLFDRQRRVTAVVGADGTIVSGDTRGSIHKVGAALQNAPSCNGWTFWHLDQDGALVPLDTLRATALAALVPT